MNQLTLIAPVINEKQLRLFDTSETAEYGPVGGHFFYRLFIGKLLSHQPYFPFFYWMALLLKSVCLCILVFHSLPKIAKLQGHLE